jgi:hypothetical protein
LFNAIKIPQNKLINAKYCDQFAHVLWHDGTLMHVHVTPDLHRNYEQKVNILLSQYEKRIEWLSKGSRELFGTVIENNICILIDTSQSMQIGLDFVKRKLAVLMQVKSYLFSIKFRKSSYLLNKIKGTIEIETTVQFDCFQ